MQKKHLELSYYEAEDVHAEVRQIVLQLLLSPEVIHRIFRRIAVEYCLYNNAKGRYNPCETEFQQYLKDKGRYGDVQQAILGVIEYCLNNLQKSVLNVGTTNSQMGSVHWFNTLISEQKDIGEFLKENTPSEEVLREWGQRLINTSIELQAGFARTRNKNDVLQIDEPMSLLDIVDKLIDLGVVFIYVRGSDVQHHEIYTEAIKAAVDWRNRFAAVPKTLNDFLADIENAVIP